MPKKQYTILLVDDSEFVLEMYALRLQEAGYKILAASNADKGLEITLAEKPDLVFCDIVMPGHDGFWYLDQIRKHADPAIAGLPVAMLTNLDDPSMRRKCIELNCLYYLIKPLYTPSQLAKLVEDFFATKKKPSTLNIQR